MGRSVKIIFFILLLTSSVLAIATDDTVTTLPYTITDAHSGTSGDHHTIGIGGGSILHSDDQAFIFTTTDSIRFIDFLFESDDTLYWGEGGDKNETGMDVRATGLDRLYNITFSNVNLVYNPPADSIDPDIAMRPNGVLLSDHDSYNIVFDSCYFKMVARGAQVCVGGDAFNIDFYDCVFDNQSVAFQNREDWLDFAMLAFSGLDTTTEHGTGGTFNYHVRIRQCSTASANWVNYYFFGDSVYAVIDSNYPYLDARNDFDTSAAPQYGSAEQCYAIGLRGNGEGCVIDISENTFRSGTSYAGGDGIFITGNGKDTTIGGSIYIHDNDFQVDKGFAGEFNTSTVIKARQTASNIRISNNTILTNGSSEELSYRAGQRITGIRLEESTVNPTNIIIEKNTIEVRYNGREADSLAACIEVAGIDSTDASTIYIRNNNLIAGHANYIFGSTNADPDYVTFLTIEGDTVAYSDSSTSPTVFFFDGTGSADNFWRDGTLIGSADYNDMAFRGGVSGDVTTEITATLTINSGGSPLSAATVSLWNDYGDTSSLGDTLWTRSTSGSGEVSGVLSIEYQESGVGDSLHASFSPWVARVSKSGFTTLNTAIDWDTDNADTTVSITAEASEKRWRAKK